MRQHEAAGAVDLALEVVESRHDAGDVAADARVVAAPVRPSRSVSVAQGAPRRCRRRSRPRSAGAWRPVKAVRARRARPTCESSTVTNCSPPAWTSFSVRPRVGRISAVSPQVRCDRLSLVEICTVRAALRHRVPRDVGVGRGVHEVAAEADEHVGVAVAQGANAVDGVEAVLAGRVEAELGLQRVEEVLGRDVPRCPSCGRPARWSDRARGTGRRRACRCRHARARRW